MPSFKTAAFFWNEFATQKRAIGAIMLRELITRWGRRDFGFVWLFGENLLFSFPVLLFWYWVRPTYERTGIQTLAFLWTGYLPIILWRHVNGVAIGCIRSARWLLYHRSITPLDLFIGRCGLEAFGNIAAAAMSFAVFYMVGLLHWPNNYGVMLGGFLLMTWWCLSAAIIIAPLTERSELVAHAWNPVAYLYVFWSGFFWMAAWLPVNVRKIVLWIDPPLHAYEMIRAGYFGPTVPTYYDPVYLIRILAVMTLIGLWLLRHVRKHIEFAI